MTTTGKFKPERVAATFANAVLAGAQGFPSLVVRHVTIPALPDRLLIPHARASAKNGATLWPKFYKWRLERRLFVRSR
jgi:hypothetical protein